MPNEKIVEVDEFETKNPALSGEMTITITLTDADGGTDLLAVHEGLPSGVSPSDNETGWRMALVKLAALVEKEVASETIEKQIELKAPLSRVWRALTDFREFGEWFGVKLDGHFKQGQIAHGKITHPGYEHLDWEVVVQKMVPENLFSFTWHPYAIDPEMDYSKEPPTLVEFRLERTTGGTLLTLTESGFDKVPAERRLEAFQMNEGGWTEQMKNIERHVSQKVRSTS